MIVQSIDGDSLVLTKTELSEQGQNSDFLSRTISYVPLVDLGANLYPKMGTIGCKAFGEEATEKIRKAVRAALKAKKGSKKKKK